MAHLDLHPPFGEGLDRNEPILVGSSDDEEDNIQNRRTRRLGGPQGTPIPRRAPELNLRIFSPPPPPPAVPLNLLQAIPFLEDIGQHQLMRILYADRIHTRAIPAFVRTRQLEPAEPEPYDVRMTHASARPRLGFTFDFEQPEEEDKVVTQKGRIRVPVKYKQTIEIPDSPPLAPQDHKRKGKGKGKAVDHDEMMLDGRHKEIIEIYSDDEEEGGDTDLVASSSQQPEAAANGWRQVMGPTVWTYDRFSVLRRFSPPAILVFAFTRAARLSRVTCSSGLALDFTLRHIHHAHPDTGRILWADADVSVASESENVHTVDTRYLTIQKPEGLDEWRNKRRKTPSTLRATNTPDWKSHETMGPATDKRETLLALAKMTNNAYFKDSTGTGWYDLGGNWTSDHSIGYDPSTSGFRGHVFLSSDNQTAVLSIKGTSAIVFGGSSTVLKDKLNDNLLFSCCCARVDWTWSPVCPCFRGGGRCDQGCVEESVSEESLFYGIGINLYNNLTFMYPDAQIWLVGHSLGGSLASLIGATFGAPVVAFEAPGERLAAQRLHLPIPPEVLHITHVYNTADPIPMGACTGPTSVCYQGGYAMETRCHLGTTIVYDTLSLLHWSSDIRSHFINTIIDQMLDEDWSTKVRKSRKSKFPWPWSEPEEGDKHILSHATKIPGLIFLSGQTPVDVNGTVVPGGIKEHTAQCIKNLGNVLEAAGSSWEKVVKVNVYLKNMDDFAEMNEVYSELLPTPKPARTCIQAAKLPNDVDVEIEAIATY
ncbi:hypothetical protein OPQ81_010359 [Rhizoctonia solani]|nr:hypothetical protein OPQ81_010359 [Rhizoctonia solani]